MTTNMSKSSDSRETLLLRSAPESSKISQKASEISCEVAVGRAVPVTAKLASQLSARRNQSLSTLPARDGVAEWLLVSVGTEQPPRLVSPALSFRPAPLAFMSLTPGMAMGGGGGGVGLVAAALAAVAATWLWAALVRLVWRPYATARAFARQGVRGLPHRPFRGHDKEVKAMLAAGSGETLDRGSHDFIPRVMPQYRAWMSRYGELSSSFPAVDATAVCCIHPSMSKISSSSNVLANF